MADVFQETSGNLGSNSGSDTNSSWEGSGAGRTLTVGETEGKPNGLRLVRMDGNRVKKRRLKRWEGPVAQGFVFLFYSKYSGKQTIEVV